MVILGLDPGIARTGFGIIDTSKPKQYIRCGCLTTPQNMDLEDRLVIMGHDLEKIIVAHKPDQAVIEQVFFGANAKTAFVVAQARGVLLYIIRQHLIPIEHLTPLQIKSRLTGYGAADKHQVQTIVTQRLGLSQVPQPDDAADALAAALSVSDKVLTQIT